MFSFVKKYNEGSKDDCYLKNSGVLEQEILDQDTMENYNDYLDNPKIPCFFKGLIKNILIPYKISLLKFIFNTEYFEKPYPADFLYDHKHIAPSLKKIKEESIDIPMGYPNWFVVVFPDVALWAIKGSGKSVVKNKLKNLSAKDLDDSNHLRVHLLEYIVELYLRKTNKPLECKNINYE